MYHQFGFVHLNKNKKSDPKNSHGNRTGLSALRNKVQQASPPGKNRTKKDLTKVPRKVSGLVPSVATCTALLHRKTQVEGKNNYYTINFLQPQKKIWSREKKIQS